MLLYKLNLQRVQVATDGWVRVHWDSGQTNSYRMGKENRYDLKLADVPNLVSVHSASLDSLMDVGD